MTKVTGYPESRKDVGTRAAYIMLRGTAVRIYLSVAGKAGEAFQRQEEIYRAQHLASVLFWVSFVATMTTIIG